MNQIETTDIEQLRKHAAQLEKDIAHLIRHDQLTGLMNRSAFVSDVDRIITATDYSQTKGAMIEIGIRGIPRITGSLGRLLRSLRLCVVAGLPGALRRSAHAGPCAMSVATTSMLWVSTAACAL